MKEGSPKIVHLCDYAPPAFLIDTVELHFDLDAAETRVYSKLAMRRNPAVGDVSAPLVLDGEDLLLDGIALDGDRLAAEQYRCDRESLTIDAVPQRFRLEILTRIRPANNSALEGLYVSGDMLCTQCEAQGFRRMTYFLDRPDVMASYTTTLAADRARYPVLLANGNLIDSGDLDGSRHFATWQDPYRKPSYLFALAAGDLACIEDAHAASSGRRIRLCVYVQHHNKDKCAHALASLKKAMNWDERTYGLEYDLDAYMIVAVDHFNMGAMENKGLNLFNSKYVLARPETATDDDYQDIEAVIGHEYFHNWTGNRVTCRDWFQLSLKEGLTVFREQQFAADMNSPALRRIEDVRLLRSRQFAEDASPMAHPVRPQSYIEINNFYTATVYEKGAEVVRMLHTFVGRDGFRAGLRLYLERFDGGAATVEDFVDAMGEANGIDLRQFMRWYDQAGTPELHVTGAWDPDRKTYRLDIRQTCPPTADQPEKSPFHIPLPIGLLTAAGAELPLRLDGEREPGETSRVLEIREAAQQFVFTHIPEQPVPSLLRGFAAPVTLLFDYTDEQLAFLLAHDHDPFNRWDAGQRLLVKLILRLIAAYRQNAPLNLDRRLIAAFAGVLRSFRTNPALTAELLGMPSETEVSGVMDEVDVDAIRAVHAFVRRALAEALEPQWLDVYQNTGGAGGDDDDNDEGPADAARRRLRDQCLGYLTALPEPRYRDLALEQFRRAANMTDAMGALSALNDCEGEPRATALEAFHARWRDDSLVLDKWFILHATSRLPGTLTTVRKLTEHPLFSLGNPNKVRALIGAFANHNPGAFHGASGEGYVFVADQVLRLDLRNPQIAARLAGAFTRWRRYDPSRRALMHAQLQRIVARPGLSRDVAEIVSRSLD